MDIRELKNACNEKYAQAIEGMERGDANAEIARLLLDAAELLVKISKADFLTRAASENKAAKLLAAAKKLRATGKPIWIMLCLQRKLTMIQAEF